MGDRIERRAYAKVNLGLDITGLREDGYHLVRMVMQQIGLYDVLTFEKQAAPGVQLRLTEDCTIPDIADMPLDDRNLIVRAAKAVLEKYQIRCGVTITLEKHIPMAAGMAGGSTDCAAALQGVAELFETGATPEELAELGVRLGADVPYCLMGGTALAEGIGEKLTRLPDLPPCQFLIIKPSFGVSTKEVYTSYDSQDPAAVVHPDIDGMVAALQAGDLRGVTDRLGNVLEPVTVANHPEISKIEACLRELGVMSTIMTGSGPTVFGILPAGAGAEGSGTEAASPESAVGEAIQAGVAAASPENTMIDDEPAVVPDIPALQEKLAAEGISAMIFLTSQE